MLASFVRLIFGAYIVLNQESSSNDVKESMQKTVAIVCGQHNSSECMFGTLKPLGEKLARLKVRIVRVHVDLGQDSIANRVSGPSWRTSQRGFKEVTCSLDEVMQVLSMVKPDIIACFAQQYSLPLFILHGRQKGLLHSPSSIYTIFSKPSWTVDESEAVYSIIRVLSLSDKTAVMSSEDLGLLQRLVQERYPSEALNLISATCVLDEINNACVDDLFGGNTISHHRIRRDANGNNGTSRITIPTTTTTVLVEAESSSIANITTPNSSLFVKTTKTHLFLTPTTVSVEINPSVSTSPTTTTIQPINTVHSVVVTTSVTNGTQTTVTSTLALNATAKTTVSGILNKTDLPVTQTPTSTDTTHSFSIATTAVVETNSSVAPFSTASTIQPVIRTHSVVTTSVTNATSALLLNATAKITVSTTSNETDLLATQTPSSINATRSFSVTTTAVVEANSSVTPSPKASTIQPVIRTHSVVVTTSVTNATSTLGLNATAKITVSTTSNETDLLATQTPSSINATRSFFVATTAVVETNSSVALSPTPSTIQPVNKNQSIVYTTPAIKESQTISVSTPAINSTTMKISVSATSNETDLLVTQTPSTITTHSFVTPTTAIFETRSFIITSPITTTAKSFVTKTPTVNVTISSVYLPEESFSTLFATENATRPSHSPSGLVPSLASSKTPAHQSTVSIVITSMSLPQSTVGASTVTFALPSSTLSPSLVPPTAAASQNETYDIEMKGECEGFQKCQFSPLLEKEVFTILNVSTAKVVTNIVSNCNSGIVKVTISVLNVESNVAKKRFEESYQQIKIDFSNQEFVAKSAPERVKFIATTLNCDVRFKITLTGDCDTVKADQNSEKDFVRAFKLHTATALGVEENRITVEAVACGSILVTFTLSDGKKTNITQKLEELVEMGNLEVVYRGNTFPARSVQVVEPSKPTQKPEDERKESELSFILYVTFGALMGVIFLIGLLVLVIRCQRDRSAGGFTLNPDEELQLKRFTAIPRASYYQVDFYGSPQEIDASRGDADEDEFEGGIAPVARISSSQREANGKADKKDTGDDVNDVDTNQDDFSMGHLPKWDLPKLAKGEVAVSPTENKMKVGKTFSSQENLIRDEKEIPNDSSHAYDNPALSVTELESNAPEVDGQTTAVDAPHSYENSALSVSELENDPAGSTTK